MLYRIYVGTLVEVRLKILEYSSKLLHSIYLGKRSNPTLMINPGKGIQPKIPSEIFIKLFKRKSREFS
jgi:hypothetical protein